MPEQLISGTVRRKSMRKLLVVLSFAAGVVGLACNQSATAAPADPAALKEAAVAASQLQQAQYVERHTRHGVVKCYREFVIGPYRCHHFW
jgi:hypothetical protein